MTSMNLNMEGHLEEEQLESLSREELVKLLKQQQLESAKQSSISSSRGMDMFQSGDGADCVIEVVQDGQEKKEFNVHKYVLMFHSDVFRAMFNHKSTRESQQSRITMTDSTGTTVHQMLIYMYTHELPKEEYAIETDAIPLMSIANKYQINPLVQLIEQGLKKSKRVRNPQGNAWKRSNAGITISNDGLNTSNNTNEWPHIYAEKGFPISGQHSREDNFPGTICYYYEVKILTSEHWCLIGLTDGEIPLGEVIGLSPNYYAIDIPIANGYIYHFYLAGQHHHYAFPEGVIRPELKDTGNVAGCGILMNPDDKLAIFFTFNGILIDRQIPIDPTVDHLVPSVPLWDDMSLEANFGDNPAKPFEYDIKKCPGMGLEWI